MRRIFRPRVVVPLISTLLVSGCNPIFYSPNTQNVLLPAASGDVTLSAHADGNRIEAQAAYAPTDALALQLNGGIFDRGDDEDEEDGGSGRFLELGVGYVNPIGSNLAWELSGLLGVGSLKNDFPSTLEASPETTGKLEADLVRFGIQPAIGYRSPYFEAAISTRLLGLSYRNVSGSLIFGGEDQVQMLTDSPGTYFLAEPALTLRAGVENIKLQVQTARSFNLTEPDFRQDESMLTVGVVVGLARRR